MRIVHAVGSGDYWPFEVYALFADEREALRHSEAAAYRFGVFPLPVYERYDDCPARARFDRQPAGARLSLARDEIAMAGLVLQSEGAEPDGAPVYAVHSDVEPEPEVYVLYASAEQAQRHIDAKPGGSHVRELAVYSSYEQCPPSGRYTDGGGWLSQKVGAKDRPPR